MDVLTLSRLQFAATISFHYIYPPLSIGLGVVLVIMEALWLKTKNPLYTNGTVLDPRSSRSFAIGVATGIVMG
jgi:cytochrome d ubiquinol oxidase subunit I